MLLKSARPVLWSLAVLTAALSLAACGSSGDSTAKAEPEKPVAPRVEGVWKAKSTAVSVGVISSDKKGDVTRTKGIKFVPVCDSGPCDFKATPKKPAAPWLATIQSDETSYIGKGESSQELELTCSDGSKAPLEQTFTRDLKVAASETIDGVNYATKLTGTSTVVYKLKTTKTLNCDAPSKKQRTYKFKNLYTRTDTPESGASGSTP